jgi:predicted RNA polymerase sigma factor
MLLTWFADRDRLLRAGRYDEARDAFDLALSRCDNEAERRHLRSRRGTLPN